MNQAESRINSFDLISVQYSQASSFSRITCRFAGRSKLVEDGVVHRSWEAKPGLVSCSGTLHIPWLPEGGEQRTGPREHGGCLEVGPHPLVSVGLLGKSSL